MKTATIKWAFVALAFGTMFACKKEKSESSTPSCEVSMSGLSGSYRLTGLEYKSPTSTTPVDFLAAMDDCEKDDMLTLNSNGTYKYDDMGTVCSPSGSEQGTWTVSGKTLTSDGILSGTVASYDCKTLVYYVENALTKGDRMTYTLVKK
ncbi:lipocalin family protein [Chitinophaga sp. Cy-1792]|uniref:lipocalin family protein n=1 Tax=Chitinophaga sp. Cy-1792 TaxID=2608339 RepID=UPI00142087E3|nr:lipocalin family protein [Chitinophaga sp. Cy-1792]